MNIQYICYFIKRSRPEVFPGTVVGKAVFGSCFFFVTKPRFCAPYACGALHRASAPFHAPQACFIVSAAASAVAASEVVRTAAAAEEVISAAAEEDQENDDPSAAVTAEKSVVASHS